jgi:hypothetical protein
LCSSRIPEGNNGNTLTPNKHVSQDKGSVRQTVSGGKQKKKSLFGLFVSTKVNFIKCNITQNTCAFKKTQLWMRLMV